MLAASDRSFPSWNSIRTLDPINFSKSFRLLNTMFGGFDQNLTHIVRRFPQRSGKKRCVDEENSPASSRVPACNNHSEIEKRRRDRMNTLMSQLASLVPMPFKQKLDKLSLLRTTLQYIHAISCSNDEDSDCSGMVKHLTSRELVSLIQRCVHCFLAVINVETGQILYASEDIKKVTNLTAEDFIKRNWFELLHSDDVEMFKYQMKSVTTFDETCSPESSCGDSVSSTTYTQLCQHNLQTGTKRSFVCRIKTSNSNSVSLYEKFRGHGVLRSNKSGLLAVIILKKASNQVYYDSEFSIRISVNGRIVQCDPSISDVFGYVQHDLVGRSYYDIIHEGDLIDVAHHHKQVLRAGTLITRNASYRLRCELNGFVLTECKWKLFTNPWNETNQFIVIIHTIKCMRYDREVSAPQSVLKQMLSEKAGMLPNVPILGAARFGDAIQEHSTGLS